ncbi:hypothetical protein [Alteromonas sp. H39]|uniref:hypothetical protein n=1 Tax=Alteromonas sp. H39 TaxID=3389876 RepID=UPI0039E1D9A4
MNEFELVADLYRQIAFSAAILGGFAMTYLSTLITAAGKRARVLPFTIGAMAVAATLLVVATLGATLLLMSVQQLSLTFQFDRWPEALVRSKWIAELSFFTGLLALMAGIGLSGFIKSRNVGYLTAGSAIFGLLLLSFVFLPTF